MVFFKPGARSEHALLKIWIKAVQIMTEQHILQVYCTQRLDTTPQSPSDSALLYWLYMYFTADPLPCFRRQWNFDASSSDDLLVCCFQATPVMDSSWEVVCFLCLFWILDGLQLIRSSASKAISDDVLPGAQIMLMAFSA